MPDSFLVRKTNNCQRKFCNVKMEFSRERWNVNCMYKALGFKVQIHLQVTNACGK